MTAEVLERLRESLSERYRLGRELGAGGMATVYLAHDLKHDRDVAIKVLHQELAAALGPERFLAEIKTTAKLQHPHILPLLDSGSADGLLYYVMPYVAGESLRDRLTREKQLPIEDAVRIAREVADALGHAHGHSIIHRDIKPENILLQEGHALVADFGIALAVQSAGGQRMTQTGLSLGTPQYMSPEQAMGERAVDARADIYALGAVTYEMLTGEPPFTGATVQAIVAKVMSERPTPPTMIRDTIPRYLEAAILKALAKLPADRWGTAVSFADACAARESILDPAIPTSRRVSAQTLVAYSLFGIVSVIAAATWLSRPDAEATGIAEMRLSIVLPESTEVSTRDYGRHVAITPDGQTVLFVGIRDGVARLYARALGDTASHPIPGTEGVREIAAMDDNKSVAAVVGNAGQYLLKRFAIDGSSATVVTTTFGYLGASPVAGEILLTIRDQQGLLAVPTDGSTPHEVAFPAETFHLSPTRLAGRDEFLAASASMDGFFSAASVLKQGTPTRAITRRGPVTWDAVKPGEYVFGTDVRFDGMGYLWLTRYDGTVTRIVFDADRLAVQGDETVVLRDVRVEPYTWFSQYALARTGTVVYAPGLNANSARFVWVDQSGRTDTLPIATGVHGSFRLSRDGRRLIAARLTPGQKAELVVYDLTSPSPPRRVPDQSPGPPAAFWPDAESFAYLASNGYIVRRSANTMVALDSVKGRGWGIDDVSPDGRTILLSVLGGGGESGLWLVSWPSGVRTVIDRDGTAGTASFSPDGRRIAFSKVYAGEFHVFVRALRGDTTAVRVGLGFGPAWAPDGEAVYSNNESGVVMVRVLRNGFGPTETVPSPPFSDVSGRDVDVGPDGRLLVLAQLPQPPIRELRLIFPARR